MPHIPWRWHILTTSGNVFNWSADRGVNILSVLPLHSSSASMSRYFSHDSSISLSPTNMNCPVPDNLSNFLYFFARIPPCNAGIAFTENITGRRSSILFSFSCADFICAVRFAVTTVTVPVRISFTRHIMQNRLCLPHVD